jgi:hypothetical protein
MLPVRTMRPVYVDRLPPCNRVCPAGENVQAWLAEAQAGHYREAWNIIVRDKSDVPCITITTPMPHVGDDPVSLTVAPNSTTTARSGTITVRDKVVRITQSGR